MSKLSKIQKSQSIQVINKEKGQQLKGGGVGNYHRKDGKNCPPPFEPEAE